MIQAPPDPAFAVETIVKMIVAANIALDETPRSHWRVRKNMKRVLENLEDALAISQEWNS